MFGVGYRSDCVYEGGGCGVVGGVVVGWGVVRAGRPALSAVCAALIAVCAACAANSSSVGSAGTGSTWRGAL